MDGGAPIVTADDDPSVPASFRDVIGYNLRIAQDASFHAIRQGAIIGDIKPGWYTLLCILNDRPGLTPGELSQCCGRDRSTLTGTLKELAAAGLIARRRKSNDQRSYSVRLTPKGVLMLDRMRVHADRHDARLDAIVGEHKGLLLELLRRIVNDLKQDQQERDQTP